MRQVFVDTHGWAEFLNDRAEHHNEAKLAFEFHTRSGATLVTSNYILSEMVALLTLSRFQIGRHRLIELLTSVRRLRNLQTIHVGPELDELAWMLFFGRPDKEWSLVDCSSFVIMEQRGIRDVLTSDHHFKQSGFNCLLPLKKS